MTEMYLQLSGGGRLSFGGDEFIFVELSEEMRIQQALTIQTLARTLTAMNLPGVTDVCPAHASYMIRYIPERVNLPELLATLQEVHEETIMGRPATINTRIVEVPVYYNDPWTRETLMKFRDRHHDPSSTDIEYTARVNGFESIDELIAAHTRHPFLVTFMNFVPGNAESVQLVPRHLQIEAPKYKSPRTETPSRAVGHGGAFANIYPSAGAGGVQLLGRTPINVVDMAQSCADFRERPVLLPAGTLISFRAISEAEYFDIRAAVDADEYRVRVADIEFSVGKHIEGWEAYNDELLEALQ